MGFIEREVNRIEAALLAAPEPSERFGQLFAAQQALKWATEPQGFAAPLDVIERGAVQLPMPDTLGETVGCLAAAHPAPS